MVTSNPIAQPAESAQVDVQTAPPAPEATPATADSIPGPSTPKHQRPKQQEPLEPLEDLLHRRVTRIKEGDNVLLRMPSDAIKAVVASKDGLVQLGKFGAFPASQLLGLHYDITYEIQTPKPSSPGPGPGPVGLTVSEAGNEEAEEGAGAGAKRTFGQPMGKKAKKQKGKGKDAGGGEWRGQRTNPAWNNVLRPLKRKPIVEAVIEDIQETNEFITDSVDAQAELLSSEEIAELRAQGLSAEEIMQRQIERHESFGLKTEFSKEKWRKRKEAKYLQTVHPLAPSIPNITTHYLTRAPQSIMYLREDTLSQLLTLSNIRPEGRYLVVDDTGGLVTSAILDRMGCRGRLLTFVDSDSPPAWGVLSVLNWSERELECVKWLNWMEAEEDYERPDPPAEDNLPAIAIQKTQARQRRHNAQVADLNATRNELHMGNWDGLIVASDLSPISILAKLTPYIIGSGTITVYSPYQQVLTEVLQYTKKNANYLAPNLTESWTRTYQVLPGRTHPMMTTSATGGYLFNAIRVLPSPFEADSSIKQSKRRKNNKPKVKDGVRQPEQSNGNAEAGDTVEGDGEEEGQEGEEMEQEAQNGGDVDMAVEPTS